MRILPHKNEHSEQGTALLEACLVLPVLIILVAGVFDLSVAFSQYLSLSEIAYQVARGGTYSNSMPTTNFSCFDGLATGENALTSCGAGSTFNDLRALTSDLADRYFTAGSTNRLSLRAEYTFSNVSGEKLFQVRLSSDSPTGATFLPFITRIAVSSTSPYFGT